MTKRHCRLYAHRTIQNETEELVYCTIVVGFSGWYSKILRVTLSIYCWMKWKIFSHFYQRHMFCYYNLYYLHFILYILHNICCIWGVRAYIFLVFLYIVLFETLAEARIHETTKNFFCCYIVVPLIIIERDFFSKEHFNFFVGFCCC